jgi:4-aminobutyrate aminotransferase-like enzyme
MLQYQSSLANRPPPAQALAQQAQQALAQSAYQGQNHQDVFRGMGQMQAVDMQRYAQQQEDQYKAQQQEAQRGLALAGLRMQAEGQQNQTNLTTSRLQMLLNNLL